MEQISERIGILLGLKAGVEVAMAEEYLTDDEQLEAVKRAFTEYAPWILGGVVLGRGRLVWGSVLPLASKRPGAAGGGSIQPNDACAANERFEEVPARSPMASSRIFRPRPMPTRRS